MKVRTFVLLLLPVCLAMACRNSSRAVESPEPQVPDVGNGWLSFSLEPQAQHGKRLRYRATYAAEGKTARFDLELTSADPTGDPPIAFSSGKFLSVAGSDASVLLKNLKKTLEARTVPAHSERVTELPFTAAILGTDQSHSPDGGFFSRPPGHWTAMKIFLGKNGEAEVFLNFNDVLHKGEFSIKDPDYGDDVLRELAKVL